VSRGSPPCDISPGVASLIRENASSRYREISYKYAHFDVRVHPGFPILLEEKFVAAGTGMSSTEVGKRAVYELARECHPEVLGKERFTNFFDVIIPSVKIFYRRFHPDFDTSQATKKSYLLS
jgi:hypothetical protein